MTSVDTVTLGAVATIDRASVQPKSIKSGTRYVGLEDIESGGALASPRSVEAGQLKSIKFVFTGNHILFGKLRPYLAKIAAPEFSGICSTDILPILPGPRVDRRYLLHFLRQPSTVAQASARSAGINLPRISPKVLEEFELPLPEMAEQRRIANVLDQADELLTKRRAAIASLGTLSESTFIKLFGDPEANPNGWPVVPLAKAVKPGTIVTYGIVQAGDECTAGVPYIRTGDIVDGEIVDGALRRTAPEIAARFARSRVDSGDIVMSIRATVGTTAMVPENLDGANLTQGTARIAPSETVLGRYLLQMLRTPGMQQWIQRQVKGATFREITLARLRELPVMVPPVEAQEEFEQHAKSVERIKQLQRGSLAELEALFASLQARAFQGVL